MRLDAPAGVGLGRALDGRRVVLCLGSGGVGKTTASAALALALARRGERVVVLTIDPARRLADALGVGGQLSNEPTRVAEFPTGWLDGSRSTDRTPSAGGEVWAAMLDPAETFRRVVEDEAPTPERAQRILANRLFVNLTTTLSGTNEYMAAERLHQLHGDPRFDRVVIDTPPSRHVFDFLDSPGRLTRFVDHRLYRSVLAPRHGLLRPLNLGAQAVMRLLGRLVGSTLVDDVVTFFGEFEGLDQGFRRRAAEIDAILAAGETAYLVVTTPRLDRLAEAEWIIDNLERRARRPDGLIVNRILDLGPATSTGDGGPEPGPSEDTGAPVALAGPLAENLAQLEALADLQADLVGPLVQRVVGPARDQRRGAVVELPEQLVPVNDLEGLDALARVLDAAL